MVTRYLAPALGIVGATFVLLFVILSVPLWVAFVATGGAVAAYLMCAGAVVVAARRGAGALAAAPLNMGGLLLGAGALVVMYVVLGLALWISVLGAFGVLAASALAHSLVAETAAASPDGAAESSPRSVRPSLAGHARGNGETRVSRHGDPAAA